MILDFNDWNYSRCKGRIAAFVARGNESPEKIVRSIQTTLVKRNLDRKALKKMLAEVESESVEPFLGPPWNQPERLVRFNVIRDHLIKDGEVRTK